MNEKIVQLAALLAGVTLMSGCAIQTKGGTRYSIGDPVAPVYYAPYAPPPVYYAPPQIVYEAPPPGVVLYRHSPGIVFWIGRDGGRHYHRR